MGNNQNLLLAVVLSLAVLFGFNYFYDKPRIEAARQAQLEQQLNAKTAAVPAAIAAPDTPAAKQTREAIIAAGFAASQRVKIDTPRLHGSLNLKGGRIDDLTLADYHVNPDKASAEVVLLSPSGTADPDHAYYAETGWLSGAAGEGVKVPDADTLWTTTSTVIAKDQPITLSWDNGQGLKFERIITLDDNFMFSVEDRINNASAAPVTIYPFSLVARHATPPQHSIYILHEGPLGVFNDTLKELKYADLLEEKQVEQTTNKGGWIGMTDKYWLVALVPDQSQPMVSRFTARDKDGAKDNESFQTDARGPATTVAAGQSITQTSRIFAGAKEVKLLEAYGEKYAIKNFDLAVDFGWFYFLTKPYFHGLDMIAIWLKDTGYGFGFAILIFTILLKLAFFPLQSKSYRSMNRMKEVQPRMAELRERWAHDKQRLNVEMFEMYRKEKINLMSGCWPVLIQIPIFFALYKVLYVTIEMRHAPFPGWIRDLAAPDPTSLFNLFGLIPWNVPHFLMIGIWPLLMGITMALQQRLSPPPADPVQKTMFRWLPVFFTVLMAQFPAGLVIYWTWSNTLGILQQLYLKRKPKVDATGTVSV